MKLSNEVHDMMSAGMRLINRKSEKNYSDSPMELWCFNTNTLLIYYHFTSMNMMSSDDEIF